MPYTNYKDVKLFLILHNIRSAYNVGSIFRTGDAVGIGRIYLCGITPTPLENSKFKNQNAKLQSKSQNLGKVEKTALGAEEFVSWEYCSQTWRLLERLKKQGVQIVALEQDPKAIDYRKFKPKFPMALVLGNEVGGLSRAILKYCNKIISIPMFGKKESLNVSVAAGIALYHCVWSRFASRVARPANRGSSILKPRKAGQKIGTKKKA